MFGIEGELPPEVQPDTDIIEQEPPDMPPPPPLFFSVPDPFKIVVVDSKMGTKNYTAGKVGLATVYEKIIVKSNGYAIIIKDGLFGFAKTSGEIIVPTIYESIVTNTDGHNKILNLFVKSDGKFGILDIFGGVVVRPIFDVFTHCDCNNNSNLLIAIKDQKYGLIDLFGNVIIEPKYKHIRSFFTNGFVQITEGTPPRYGLADTLGNILLEPIQNYIDWRPDDKLIIFMKDGLFGAMLGTGEIILRQEYTEIYNAINGIVKVSKNNKHGWYDLENKLLIEPVFSQVIINDFGWIEVYNKEDKTGILTKRGDTIIKFLYEELGVINENKLFFKKAGKYGLMNQQEKVVKTFDYNEMQLVGDFFAVEKGGKWGIIDGDGNILLALKWDILKDAHDYYTGGISKAKKNGTWYMVDRYGNESPVEY